MKLKTTWSYVPINFNTNIGTLENITQTAFFKNNIDGEKIRLKFSNIYGQEKLVLNQVIIAKRRERSKEIFDFTKITYGGSEQITIGSGDEIYTDTIDFTIKNNEVIVISVYFKDETDIYSVCSNWYGKSWYSEFSRGNNTQSQNPMLVDTDDVLPILKFDPNKARHLIGLTEINILPISNIRTLTLFGDSITHMSYYSDALFEKILDEFPGQVAILNAGIGGNRLLRDYSRVETIPGGGTIFGPSGVKRFYSNVFEGHFPEDIIVLIGINDIIHPYTFNRDQEIPSLEEYIDGIKKLIEIAHKQNSRIYIGTIMPFKNEENIWYKEAETLRREINIWIRQQIDSDGIIDFDFAVRDSLNPQYMCEDYHLGDGLHPNAAGGEKMAQAVYACILNKSKE